MAEKFLTKEDFIVRLKADVDKDYSNSENYRQKIANAHNQRLGFRQDSKEPWPGAPNYSMPFTDKLIRKQVPPMVLSIFNAKNMASVSVEEGIPDVTGILKQKAKRAEKILNLFLRKDKSMLNTLSLAASYAKEKGRCYFLVFKTFKNKYEYFNIKVSDLEKSFDRDRDRIIGQFEQQGLVEAQIPPEQLPLTGEEQISALKELDQASLVQILSDNPEFGINIDDPAHLEIAKEVVEQFKSGNEELTYSLPQKKFFPKIMAVPPEDIVVPKKTPIDIQKSWRITRSYWLNKDQIIDLADEGIFDKEVVMEYLKENRTETNVDEPIIYKEAENVSGVFGDIQGMFYLRDVWCYYEDEKGQLAKYILTYFVNDKQPAFLRFERNDTPDDKFPFVVFDNELTIEDAYSSRGIPEVVRYVQETIDDQNNNRIVRDIVQNTPMFTIRRNAGITGQEIRFVPGQGISVADPSDITFFNPIKGADVASERIEAIQKTYGEEVVGSIDFAFGKSGVPGTRSGAKTLGEIQIAQGEGQKIASLDLLRWFASWNQALSLYYEILKETFDGRVTIGDETFSKQDLFFPSEVRSNGSVEDADRFFKAQKQLTRYQLVVQSPPDTVTPEDRFNALFDYLEADGVENPDRYITDPKEILQDQSVQLQQQVQQLQQASGLLQKDLEDKEKDLASVEEKTRRATVKNQAKSESRSVTVEREATR